MGDEQLAAALKGCELVIIPAGVPRKPGMTRDDLFKINAGIVKGLVTAIGKHCPGAWINMISNPVNSTVPIAAETLKAMGVYDPKRLFGVTTLDVVRAHTFFASKKGLDVSKVEVPVVGGHAGITILPLLSKATPATALTDEEVDALTKRTQDGGTEVVAAKAGKGSATLSMAYAGSLFADACLRAMNGEKDVHQYTYVQSTVQPGVSFFASRVLLGKSGAEKIYPLPAGLTPYETAGVQAMIPELKSSIGACPVVDIAAWLRVCLRARYPARHADVVLTRYPFCNCREGGRICQERLNSSLPGARTRRRLCAALHACNEPQHKTQPRLSALSPASAHSYSGRRAGHSSRRPLGVRQRACVSHYTAAAVVTSRLPASSTLRAGGRRRRGSGTQRR
jgi:malate dehydrogenase